jgi:hypothetical protein
MPTVAENLTSIATKMTTLNGIKTDIKAAINGKGGNVGDNMSGYATAISGLQTGGSGGSALSMEFTGTYLWTEPITDEITLNIPVVTMTAPT